MLGNANKHAEQAAPPDLVTPTLKSEKYTTGRGGTGNMAVNDPKHPELARESQDVDAPHVALAAEKNFPTGRGRRIRASPRFFALADIRFRRCWQYPQSDGRGTG